MALFPNPSSMPWRGRQYRRVWPGLLAGLAGGLGIPGAASAHEAPEGSEYILADWMFLSFVAFAGCALVVFLIALKLGLLSNMEEAKLPMLEIQEEDYYTPDWAKTEAADADA
jgi:hypothetical protein